MTTGMTLPPGCPADMKWHEFWWECEAEARDNPAAMSDLMKVAGERALEALFDGMAPSGAVELVYTTMVACQRLEAGWAGEAITATDAAQAAETILSQSVGGFGPAPVSPAAGARPLPLWKKGLLVALARALGLKVVVFSAEPVCLTWQDQAPVPTRRVRLRSLRPLD